MSQVSPGWYPDPSGRYAQRYHDGTRWTEHVADAAGQRSVDNPEAQAAPAADPYQSAGQGYGAAGYGQQSGSQGWESRAARPAGRATASQPGSGESWPPGRRRAAARAGRRRRPGLGQQGYGQPAAHARATASSPASTASSPRPVRPAARAVRPARPVRHAQLRPAATASRARPAGLRPAGLRRRPPPGGFTPTIGLIVGGIGGLLVLLSLFVLDFLKVGQFGSLSESASLGDVDGPGVPAALDTYAGFGRLLALLVIAFAHPRHPEAAADPAAEQHPEPADHRRRVCGMFALWHVLAMFASPEGADVSPAFGAILGLVGYARADRRAVPARSRSAPSADPTARTRPRAAPAAAGPRRVGAVAADDDTVI